MRWVARRSGRGPDGVGMVTVMCCCRARVAGGVVRGVVCQQRQMIRLQARPRVRSARWWCGRGRGRWRRGLRPRGASGVLSARTPNALRSRLLHAQRKLRVSCVCRTRPRRGLGRRRQRSRRGGVAVTAVADLGQQRRGADHRVRCEKSDRKISPSGWARSAGAISALELCDLRDHDLQRRDERSTIWRRARVSISPARPVGARAAARAAAPASAGRSSAGPSETPARRCLAQPAGVGRARVALQERERDPAVNALNRPIGPGQNRSSSARS